MLYVLLVKISNNWAVVICIFSSTVSSVERDAGQYHIVMSVPSMQLVKVRENYSHYSAVPL